MARNLQRLLQAAVLSLVGVVLVAENARSTTFVLMDESELASRSLAVIIGTVEGTQAAVDGTNGGVNTYVSIQPESVLAGAVPDGEVVLKEMGGRLSDREETLYGSPEYSAGERVLVFLSRNPDGSLRTTGMSMGKYDVSDNPTQSLEVTRSFGNEVAVLRRAHNGFKAAAVSKDTSKLDDVIARIQSVPVSGTEYSAPVSWRPSEFSSLPVSYQAAYTYLSSPARWFEPENGEPVSFLIDPTGDLKFGGAVSHQAVLQAFAAWSNIGDIMLQLTDGGPTSPQTYAGCDGGSRVIFNDPFNEITDPINCGGILAIGGYCASWQSETVNGTTYAQIAVGKVMVNNGWDSCAGWTPCNLAEVLTHEVGHAIGLGHSTDTTATMFASAHFDGRCASVENDDMEGALSLYANPDMPTWTPSATPTPTTPSTIAPPSPTATSTRPPTPTVAPANQIRPTSTPTHLVWGWFRQPPTRTPTPIPTRTRTRTPTRTLTRTPTRIPTRTLTRTPSRTPTRAAVVNPTRTPTNGAALGADTGDANDSWTTWAEMLRRLWSGTGWTN